MTQAALQTPTDRPDRLVRGWLLLVAALVFAMALVGAATRLTDSGLSITEWQPILGAIPPLSEADWQEAFAKYKTIPEYEIVNKGMSLEAFKAIYWWEWSHRLLGRLIGVVFLLPYLALLALGRLRGRLAWQCLGLFGLGGLQGAIGWYMVASGLVDRVDVSQYRLALHLTVAALIYALAIWLALSVGERGGTARGERMGRFGALAIAALVLCQIALGAFVAGLDAGMAYNTWPLMDGALVPDGLLVMSPWSANLFENALTVQFLHRGLAYVVAGTVLVHALRLAGRMPGTPAAHSAQWLSLAVLGQIGIGIWTLLMQVPIGLGLLHQAGALGVLGLAVLHLKRVMRPA
ncbi:MAG: COX15/CtaA family protein [Hyphomicrobiaceae bacterium]